MIIESVKRPENRRDAPRLSHPTVAIVNREFPSLTKTFHYREYQHLTASGLVDVRAYAFKRPAAFSQEAAPLIAATRYLPPLLSWPGTAAVRRALLRRPIRALRPIFGLVLRARPGNKEGGIAGAVLFSLRGLQLADALIADPPDIIHSQFATESATAAMVAATALGIPFSIELHSPYTLYQGAALLAYKVEHARFVTAISCFARHRLVRLCGEHIAQKTRVLHCGTDTGTTGAPHPSAAHPPTVLSVGALIPVKGHRHLLEACALLRGRGVPFRCQIVGEGPCRPELEDIIARRDLKEVVALLGAQPAEEVRQRYSRAALFVLPCCVATDGDMDGIPVVLMEAMAAGVPCVSTRVSGIPELIDSPGEGILVPENNPVALAGAMERLLLDRPLREGIARAARRKVEREFNIVTTSARLAQLFAESVSSRRPAPGKAAADSVSRETEAGAS